MAGLVDFTKSSVATTIHLTDQAPWTYEIGEIFVCNARSAALAARPEYICHLSFPNLQKTAKKQLVTSANLFFWAIRRTL
jgi:hypothetical protein